MSVKSLPWVLAGLAWLVACVCVYGIVDQSITLTHARAQSELVLARSRVMEYMLSNSLKGATRDRIMELVRRKYRDDQFFFKGDSELVVDGVGFIFKDNVLIEIETD